MQHAWLLFPQVHFVPDAGTVAQIVYTDDQVRPPQQVVYTADGTSYTSVDGPEHTLVYIHPVEAAQTLFTDPAQVAYVQQDATAQQVLPSIESVDGSDPLATLQNPMARLDTKEEEEEEEDEDEDTEEEEEEDAEDTDVDDWQPDPPRPFDPHDLCKCRHWTPRQVCGSVVMCTAKGQAPLPITSLSPHHLPESPAALGGRS